jgi:hypothetical protein
MAKNPTGSSSKLFDDPEIDPSHGMVAGKTISQWTQDWYTWAFQSSPTVSPFTPGSAGDGSGGFNAGSMFFIGGFDTSSGPLNVTVPFGERLLVPLLNVVDTLDPKSLENAFVPAFKNGTTSLFAIVDGKPLEHLQSGFVVTDFFSMGTAAPGSVLASFGLPQDTVFAPSKGVGYWIVVDGLAKGDHTLEFGGHTAYTVGSFSVDSTIHTTDNIHVV